MDIIGNASGRSFARERPVRGDQDGDIQEALGHLMWLAGGILRVTLTV